MAPFIGNVPNASNFAHPSASDNNSNPFHIELPEGLPRSDQPLADKLIDEPARLKVAVIGTGIAGLQAGVLLPHKVPRIDLTLFEKNADVSGTWYENIYPGVRCDVPAHIYQSSYEPNTAWSEEFAQGPEIKAYWQSVAKKHGVYERTKFNKKVTDLSWDPQSSTWTLVALDVNTKKDESHTFDFVITAIGRFNAWKLPDYPGIDDYEGLLRHTSNWDPSFEPEGKKIAVIGNGASGLQIVANIHPQVAHLDHYARNPTYVAESFAGDPTSIKPKIIPQELIDSFKDPDKYLKYRKALESGYWKGFPDWLKNSPRVEEDRQRLIEYARKNTPPGWLEKVIPEFPPHCRRLTPGPGYFDAITAPNTDYIQEKIKRFTKTGIETEDGVHREVDAIFCATGANVDMVPPFPIRAFGNNLPDLWRKGGAYGFPYTYLGLATPGFPNLLFIHGPNGAARAGTFPQSMEVQATALARILRKVSREGIKAIAPSQQAADDFVQYTDSFFQTTVLDDKCSSWYNSGTAGSRVHGLWPGSAAHMDFALRELRWEDWIYEYKNPINRFNFFFGKGWTAKELDDDRDITQYLVKPGSADLKTVHEGWWALQ